MYRWLLCFRYLRTRYIALASIISVTLGVATLIVVNSVMAGFSAEMHQRMHGLASDILIECHSVGGIPNSGEHLAEIREMLGDQLVGSSVSVHIPAVMAIRYHGQMITRQVNLVGVDPQTYDTVSDFGKYLLHPENRKQVDFTLKEYGYAPDRDQIRDAGWGYRRWRAAYEKEIEAERQRIEKQLQASRAAQQANSAEPDSLAEAANDSSNELFTPEPLDDDSEAPLAPGHGFIADGPVYNSLTTQRAHVFDPARETHPGIVLGIATCSVRLRNNDGEVGDHFYCMPGDDVKLMFPSASENTKVIDQDFTVVDVYESGMSEYDSTFAFVKLHDLQEFRGMVDPSSGARSVTTIQLKLAEGANLNAVRDMLQAHFPHPKYPYQIQTWKDMQGPLLAAVQLETMILNILLFLIIAVAGFGILATFFMIVVEKTRDIGTLKALGASGGGIMSIFLSYGVLLGVVGSGVGLIGGLLFVDNINGIAAVIEKVTGQEVFDPTIYYFNEIPTIVEPWTLCWVMVGAVLIATLASVLPAYRAARMHPVQSLRYE